MVEKKKGTPRPKRKKQKTKKERQCGGQSINRPIKVKIVGPAAHPRMQIRPRRPKSGRKGNHRGGGG